jgi:formate C-acetyltransferase
MEQSFKKLKSKLSRQYENIDFGISDGLPPEKMRKRLDKYFREHLSEPVIRVRAGLFSLLLQNCRLHVDPDDPFADHMECGYFLDKYREIWREECGLAPELEELNEALDKCGAGSAKLDLSHTSPNWTDILELGVTGLRNRARDAAENAFGNARAFYLAVAEVYDAFRIFILRLAAAARQSAALETAAVLTALAESPPQTLREAFQLAYLYNQLQEVEGELVRAMGHFDGLYYRFYKNDLAAGRLTREQARELIQFFWLKFYSQKQSIGKNFCFGGDFSNELSTLGYEAYAGLRLNDPKLSLRVRPDTPDELLQQAARCLGAGMTATVFTNDQVAAAMFRANGKNDSDLRDLVYIGCYEPAVMGHELSCSMEIVFNLAKPVELALNSGIDPGTGIQIGLVQSPAVTYEQFEAACFSQMEFLLNKLMELGRAYERTWSEVNPAPFLSGTMADCIKSGRDVSQAGLRYNSSGVMCAGIGTAADSLVAVRELVFRRGICSLDELREALGNNFAGRPDLLSTALNMPKWGNNDGEVDSIAAKITKFAGQLINHTPNTRGDHFQMGLWSIDLNVSMGSRTGALPDGRLDKTPLSKNLCSFPGMSHKGVTSLINSSARLDHSGFPNGSVLDVMLHPSVISGDSGVKVIIDIVRSYFKQGGLAIQFNIFDAATLRKAQKEPHNFADLQVRVCGWNVRFVDLNKESQNVFIKQAEMVDG